MVSDKETAVKLQLTEKGMKDYNELLGTLLEIYNGEDKRWEYNKEQRVLGFGKIKIKDREEILIWIKVLSFLRGIPITEEKTTTLYSDGTKINVLRIKR